MVCRSASMGSVAVGYIVGCQSGGGSHRTLLSSFTFTLTELVSELPVCLELVMLFGYVAL